MPLVNYSAQVKKMTKTDDSFTQDYNMDLFSQFDMSFAVENHKEEEIADFLTKDF